MIVYLVLEQLIHIFYENNCENLITYWVIEKKLILSSQYHVCQVYCYKYKINFGRKLLPLMS